MKRGVDALFGSRRCATFGYVLLLAAAATGVVPGRAWAQTTAARSVQGQPDMQGFWETAGGSGLEAQQNLEEGTDPDHVVLVRQKVRPRNVIVDPPDGKIPYTSWAAAIKAERFKNRHHPDPELRDPVHRCLLGGVPRTLYQSSVQIVQTPGYVVLLYEFAHAYRIVPVTPQPPLSGDIRLWMGDSRGRWEGNTLVVDVANHNALTWFDWAGNAHSDQLRVSERWTIEDANTISYEATLEDPLAYTRPWTIAFTLVRNQQAGYETLEHACYEGVNPVEQQ
jgi:hypothetical protein